MGLELIEKYAAHWSTSPTISLRVGEDFQLSDVVRNTTPGWDGTKKQAKKLTKERGKLLAELQERLFANARQGDERRVLLVLQGMDTSGKGGIVRKVLGMVDPQGVHVANFGVPTEEELSHHFLWRIRKKLPPAGKIGVFDRSHYEDVLVARVDSLAPSEEIDARYDQINAWEKELVGCGYTLIKVVLLISEEEQGMRLAERLARPDKWWKYSKSDLVTRKKWDAYQEAYRIMLERTSTSHAPWFAVPADRKWFSRLAITELLVQALTDLRQDWPVPDWDVQAEKLKLAETLPEAALADMGDELADARDSARETIDHVDQVRAAVNTVGELDAGARVDRPE